MREFQVTVPIAGVAYITVEAETEEEAIDEALGTVGREHIEDWQALRHITQGNVCYAPVWHASAEDLGPTV